MKGVFLVAHKNFSGIAVCDDGTAHGNVVARPFVKPSISFVHTARYTGVVLPKTKVSSEQRARLMRLNIPLQSSGGHLGVRPNASGGTTIMLLGSIQNQKEARAVAVHLARIVAKVIGAYSILRQLRNQRAVRSALVC